MKSIGGNRRKKFYCKIWGSVVSGEKGGRRYGCRFDEIQKEVDRGREVLHVVKTRTISKWQLNTYDNFVNLRTEDFCVGRRRSKIYTL